MTYKIENLKDTNVYGVKLFIDSKASENNEIEKAWMKFVKDVNLKGDSYGISINYNRETFEFEYIIAAEKENLISDDLKQFVIPQGKYAKFKMQGVLDKKALLDFYDKSFKELHKDNLFDDNRGVNCFEFYNQEFTNMNDPKSVLYLLIPIK